MKRVGDDTEPGEQEEGEAAVGPQPIDICPADKKSQRACLCCGLVKVSCNPNLPRCLLLCLC